MGEKINSQEKCEVPDNRESCSFGLPHKKLPEKKFGVNWFPNLDKYTAKESREILFRSGKYPPR